jgi:UDPglucose 6-dehydrogenase
MVMDCSSAELAKYAANAMLAARVTFMNEVANLCELVGADIDHVRHAIATDKRIGPAFLFPGVGYGGSCFPKDVRALIRFAADEKYDFRTLKAVEEVNAAQKKRLVGKMEKHFGSLKGLCVAVWGLAFKPRTDDMREAPSIDLINGLLSAGANVQAFDPEAGSLAKKIFGNRITIAESSYDAAAGADALAIVTEWNEFREPDFARVRKLMRQPAIFDGRNIYTPAQMKALGFVYYSIGR